MTISSKLNETINSVKSIKNAIKNKGGEPSKLNLSQLADEINKIVTEKNIEGTYLTYEDENKTVRVFSDSGNLPQALFHRNELVSKIIITEGVVNIPANFARMLSIVSNPISNNLSTVIFPDSLRTVGNEAFSGSNIQNVILNEDITFINSQAFKKCAQLLSFEQKSGGAIGLFHSNSRMIDFIGGSVGHPVTDIRANSNLSNPSFYECTRLTNVTLYVSDPANPGLPGAPWGATNAKVTYLQA